VWFCDFVCVWGQEEEEQGGGKVRRVTKSAARLVAYSCMIMYEICCRQVVQLLSNKKSRPCPGFLFSRRIGLEKAIARDAWLRARSTAVLLLNTGRTLYLQNMFGVDCGSSLV
jgi:hypothetical protein